MTGNDPAFGLRAASALYPSFLYAVGFPASGRGAPASPQIRSTPLHYVAEWPLRTHVAAPGAPPIDTDQQRERTAYEIFEIQTRTTSFFRNGWEAAFSMARRPGCYRGGEDSVSALASLRPRHRQRPLAGR